MRMLLVTAGSRGDVEPFAALARRAISDGHDVTLATPDNTGVDDVGIERISLEVDYSRIIQNQGVSVRAALGSYRSIVKPTMRRVIVGAARAAADIRPDVIVAHPKVLSAALIADALGIPHVLVELVPSVTPTRAFPAAGTVTRNLGALNRLTYAATAAAARMFRSELDEAASTLGVRRPRRDSPPTARLLPISPALFERPADWPSAAHLTGAWRTHTPPAPLDPAVEDFISSGPFVYAGFGSMAIADPAARARVLVEASRRRGERMLLATGWGGAELPSGLRGDDVLVVRTVPHDVVLPRATAAIHHGGIGTVQASTLAGTVSIVVPFIADQPFWGAMLHRRGLAPAAIPRRRLTSSRLTSALDEAPAYRARVHAASERMLSEDGTAHALDIITALG